jgi:hypothetical protein
VESRYRELRAAINDEDTEQLLQLVEWLRSRGRLELALWEVDHVLQVDPGSARAKELKTWIVEQSKVAEARRSGRPFASDPFTRWWIARVFYLGAWGLVCGVLARAQTANKGI